MKQRVLIPLALCALLLTSCYRQTEEPFQQVDSAVVVADTTPTSLALVVDATGPAAADGSDASDGGGEVVTREPYITPETVPGQIDQPTPELPTQVPLIELTEAPLSVTRFILPSPTPSFEELLDPSDPCVYSIVLGDTLFRLSLAWGTTVDDIMELNLLDSDALAIGQLLLIPGCEAPAPAATATVAPVIAEPEPEEAAPAAATDAPVAADEATPAEPIDTPTLGPRIHVVSAGETLESISLRYRADVNEIIALNNLSNPDRLNVGQELLIPN